MNRLRENRNGTIVLTDGEWNRSRYLHNGNYLLWSMELKLLKQLANGAKFEKVAEYNEEELRLIYKYEKALKEQEMNMRRRLKVEGFGAETDYDDYIDRIFTFINEKVGTEYFPSVEDEEEVARFKKDFNDEFDEVGQAIEDANDWSWNEILGAEGKRYPRSPNDEMFEGLSEKDLRTIIFAYGAEIQSMKDRENYLEKMLKNEGVWYSNPTIDDYMNEGMTKSEATSAYNINRTDELFATILYLLEYANKGGLKVKSFGAEEFEASSNYDFSQIDKILQNMDEDGSLQLTNTDGSQVRMKALRIYESIRTVQEGIKQLREENAETFRIDALENYLLRLKYDLDNELNRWAWENMNAEEFEAEGGKGMLHKLFKEQNIPLKNVNKLRKLGMVVSGNGTVDYEMELAGQDGLVEVYHYSLVGTYDKQALEEVGEGYFVLNDVEERQFGGSDSAIKNYYKGKSFDYSMEYEKPLNSLEFFYEMVYGRAGEMFLKPPYSKY